MYDYLISLGFVPTHPMAERARLSLKEERTTYIMVCGQKKPVACFRVDGYIIKEGKKCDFMILLQDGADNIFVQVLVELKGTDIEQAISQLESSLSSKILQHGSVRTRKARIVAQSFPSSKSNPAVALAKRRFLKKYNCELKTVKTNQPDSI